MALNLSLADGIPPAGPGMDLVRLKASQVVQVIVLSTDIRAVFVHWNASAGRKGRSEPCVKEKCSGCGKKLPRKWLGYVHVWLPKRRTGAFLEMSSGAAEDLRNSIPPGQTMRGTSAVVQRMGGDKARFKVDVFPAPKDYDTSVLPDELLPWETLAEYWMMSREECDFAS